MGSTRVVEPSTLMDLMGLGWNSCNDLGSVTQLNNHHDLANGTCLAFLRLPRSCAGVAHGIQLRYAITTSHPSTGMCLA